MTLLWNCLELDIFNNVACLKTSKAIQDAFQELYFFDQNLSCINQIYENIFSLQQEEGSVDDYFSKLKAIWDELNVYQPSTTDLAIQKKYRNEFQVAKFLSGLKTNLKPMGSHILFGKEISSIGETFARICKAALPHFVSKSTRLALVTPCVRYIPPYGNSGGYNRGHIGSFDRGGCRGGRGTQKCSHCERINHNVDFCWKLHGKPAWASQAMIERELSKSPLSNQITISKSEYDSMVQRTHASSSSTANANVFSSGNICLHIPLPIHLGFSSLEPLTI